MSLIKYDVTWSGIDAGREGLWREPIWSGVLRIVAKHPGTLVYDSGGPVYKALVSQFPKEKWCSTDKTRFRPLFRDYPNSWTKTGVLKLDEQIFTITQLGKDVVAGKASKEKVLLDLLQRHSENSSASPTGLEHPFAILAEGFLSYQNGLTSADVFWGIMKNFRPQKDSMLSVVKKKLPSLKDAPPATPYRRLRNMLALMRHVDGIQTFRRGNTTSWVPSNENVLKTLATTT